MTSRSVSNVFWAHSGFCLGGWVFGGPVVLLVVAALLTATNLAMFHTHPLNEGE